MKPVLSFIKGKPVAIIYGGKQHDQILFIDESEDKPCAGYVSNTRCCAKCSGACLECGGDNGCYVDNYNKCCRRCSEKCFEDINTDDDIMYLLNDDSLWRNKIKGKSRDISRLKRSFIDNDPPSDDELKELFERGSSIISNKKNKELILQDGELSVIPDMTTRECLYYAAPSGSGKSTQMAAYANNYKKLFPKNKVFIFSKIDRDEPLDRLKPIRVGLDIDLIKKITPETLKNSLCIFDDTDTLRDVTPEQKELKKSIEAIKNELLQEGRHNSVYVLISSHNITNYKDTRTVLNECHYITLFCGSGSYKQIDYCLKNYFGLKSDEIKKIKKLPSRWITLRTRYPQMVIYSKGAYLLNS